MRREYDLGADTAQTVRELGGSAILVLREGGRLQMAMICNFAAFSVALNLPELAGKWTSVIHSADARWNGPASDRLTEMNLSTGGELRLSPFSFLVLERTQPSTEAA
jgi:hypothetical protein